MGWRADLVSQRTISEQEVNSIIESLPEQYHLPPYYGLKVRQSWGWSARCDVFAPVANRISISGAYGISGDIAEEFVKYFMSELKKYGHTIKAEWSW